MLLQIPNLNALVEQAAHNGECTSGGDSDDTAHSSAASELLELLEMALAQHKDCAVLVGDSNQSQVLLKIGAIVLRGKTPSAPTLLREMTDVTCHAAGVAVTGALTNSEFSGPCLVQKEDMTFNGEFCHGLANGFGTLETLTFLVQCNWIAGTAQGPAIMHFDSGAVIDLPELDACADFSLDNSGQELATPATGFSALCDSVARNTSAESQAERRPERRLERHAERRPERHAERHAELHAEASDPGDRTINEMSTDEVLSKLHEMRSNRSKACMFSGTLKDGRFSGHGLLLMPCWAYAGRFENGLPHGENALLLRPFTATTTLKCTFDQGRIQSFETQQETEIRELRSTVAELTRKLRENETSSSQCKVCMDREAVVAFSPCRHMVCCEQCWQRQNINRISRCCVCRTVVTEAINVIRA
jgi:hypothetical protein